MTLVQEAISNATEVKGPGTGPFFLGHPKEMQPHKKADGTPCYSTIGRIIRVTQEGYYNQQAEIACQVKGCGVVQKDST